MQETRQWIMNILKERGQATVDQLSEELELTPVTIRHHLDILRSEGLIQAPLVMRRPTPGRPQHVYCLTDQASTFFPKNYAGFADLTLREIRERLGAEELDSIVRGVARRMAAEAPRPAAGESIPEQMRRVVEFLNQKGYIARWESNGQGYLLHVANCPYQALARHHAAPCAMDLAMVAELTGGAPQRINWMSGGDETCTYLVPDSDGSNQAIRQ
jgi:predicted ArsR family transcriptional regulator